MNSWIELGTYLHGLIATSLIIIQLIAGNLGSFITSTKSTTPSLPAEDTSEITIPPSIAPDVQKNAPFSQSTGTSSSKTSSPIPHKSDAAISAAKASSTTETVMPPQGPAMSVDTLNAQTRAAVVNILCTTLQGGSFAPISGSGVMIDSRGIILTNAHIGQFFLLKDFGYGNQIDCVIRTGSPAQPAYRAKLLYLPPPWIDANAQQITAQHATGTGENDYAFLVITGTTDPSGTLPASFPHLAMSGQDPAAGDEELIAAYPASFLDGITIQENLYMSSALTTVGQLYTFSSTHDIDLISLGGTVVSQNGSSGGAVVRAYDGKLIGIVATASTGTTTSARDLRAITLAHIDRSLKSLGQGGLAEFLLQDLPTAEAAFASTTAPEEEQKLIKAIPSY